MLLIRTGLEAAGRDGYQLVRGGRDHAYDHSEPSQLLSAHHVTPVRSRRLCAVRSGAPCAARRQQNGADQQQDATKDDRDQLLGVVPAIRCQLGLVQRFAALRPERL